MILASIDWLSISIDLLLILFVLVALLMSLVILMQRPKQEGLGAAFGSGMTDQMFGARTTNVLQKGTVYLGSLFFILTLTLAILYARKNERDNRSTMVKEETTVEEQVTPPVEETPAEEPAGETGTTSSLEESLEGDLGPETTGPETAPPGENSATPVDDDVEGAPDSAGEVPAEEGAVEEGAVEEAPTEETPVEAPAPVETGAEPPAGDGPAEAPGPVGGEAEQP